MGQALTAAKITLQAAQRLEEHTAIVRRLDDSIAILEWEHLGCASGWRCWA
jgi:hypothetical protein